MSGCTVLLFLLLLLLILPSQTTANEGNILATGDVLPNDGQLSYLGAAFVMQDDCNLVLYNKGSGFQSNTHGFGTNCTLTLTVQGQLLIQASGGLEVWSSPPGKRKGDYVAVLGPDGQVIVFGPAIWSTPSISSSPSSTTVDIELADIPRVRNVLFSSQVLNDGSKLTSRDYTLQITDECNLEFTKASVGVVWQSNTKGKGRNCFVRLDHRGQLAVVNDQNKVLWRSGKVAATADGNYVLVVEIHGRVVVYGPTVWSTAS